MRPRNSRTRRRGVRRLVGLVAAMLLLLTLAAPAASAQVDESDPIYRVPRPESCQPEDNPELPFPAQLQGQVPWAMRSLGPIVTNFRCNLSLVANIDAAINTDPTTGEPTFSAPQADAGFANFDVYEDCAYYSISNTQGIGMAVVDASDSSNPVRTKVLTTPGVGNPWESLRVNDARGLLAGSPSGSAWFDVYDVSEDCTDPTLLSSTEMPVGRGHEGWFQPDGMVYYQSRLGSPVVPIDLSDPTNPVELGAWGQSHGGSTSVDGSRAYFCTTSPQSVTIWDTTKVAAGEEVFDDEPALIGSTDVNGSACQQTYPLFYDGEPWLVQMGESGPAAFGQCVEDTPNFAPANLINISDETNPVVVTSIVNEVNDPDNCELILGDRSSPPEATNDNAIAYALFVYGPHQCTPDRIYDPTILACAEFLSGFRVYDIRDPYAPTEIAYFNWGALIPGDPGLEMHPARPVIRIQDGELWSTSAYKGFTVLKFAEDVYPFPESLECPVQYDYLFDQNNPDNTCEYGSSGDPAGGSSTSTSTTTQQDSTESTANGVVQAAGAPPLAATGGGAVTALVGIGLLGLALAAIRRRSAA